MATLYDSIESNAAVFSSNNPSRPLFPIVEYLQLFGLAIADPDSPTVDPFAKLLFFDTRTFEGQSLADMMLLSSAKAVHDHVGVRNAANVSLECITIAQKLKAQILADRIQRAIRQTPKGLSTEESLATITNNIAEIRRIDLFFAPRITSALNENLPSIFANVGTLLAANPNASYFVPMP